MDRPHVRIGISHSFEEFLRTLQIYKSSINDHEWNIADVQFFEFSDPNFAGRVVNLQQESPAGTSRNQAVHGPTFPW